MRNACWPETPSDALCGICELLATASCSAFGPNREKPDKKDLQILVNLSLFPFFHVMNPFSGGARAPRKRRAQTYPCTKSSDRASAASTDRSHTSPHA